MQWGLLSVGSMSAVNFPNHIWRKEDGRNTLTPLLTGTAASLVAFGINFHAAAARVPIAVYIVFIILMIAAIPIAFFFIVDPKRVQRSDGTAIRHYPHRGFMVELKNQVELLKDWRILVLTIPFFASEIAIIITSTLNGMLPPSPPPALRAVCSHWS